VYGPTLGKFGGWLVEKRKTIRVYFSAPEMAKYRENPYLG
jgi:hypothetical protein